MIDKVHAGVTDEVSGVVLTRGVWGFREASPYSHELDVDPMGFAFGGIYPGQLHAHGQFVEEHKASYSVGLAGTYKLHVRCRQEGLPVPGSPFDLTVAAGPADGHATFMKAAFKPVGKPADRVLRGTLLTCDVMGNACRSGGAQISVTSKPALAQPPTVTDMEDGSYEIQWKAPEITTELTIKIGGVHVPGSPFKVEGNDSPRKRRPSIDAPEPLTQSPFASPNQSPTTSPSRIRRRSAEQVLSLSELSTDLESMESKARHGSDRKDASAPESRNILRRASIGESPESVRPRGKSPQSRRRERRASIGESPESVRPGGASFKSNKSNNNSFRSNNDSFKSTHVSSYKNVSSYKDELSPELRDAGRCKSTSPPTTAAMPNFALRRRMSLNATGFGEIDRPTSPSPALPDA